LYLVPNLLGVVPPDAVLPRRTIEIARTLGYFVVETPKIARKFLKTLGPSRALQEIAIAELSEHTPAERVGALLAPVLGGNDLGLLSDAGCPGIADPGALLVAAAHRANVQVIPLVGPSAVLLALMASGMNGQAFAFHGYLPAKPIAREAALRALDGAVERTAATQLFIETPYRNEAMIDAVLATCAPSRQFCVAVDLTLPSEQIVSRTVGAWRKEARPGLARRPAMFLLGRV
jgi:16S rRNA (cytidine1402-2'-O)-methyltransferase